MFLEGKIETFTTLDNEKRLMITGSDFGTSLVHLKFDWTN